MDILDVPDGSAKLFVTDCRKALNSIDRGSADLVFADPPFNIGVNYGVSWDDKMHPTDFEDFTRQWLCMIGQCLRPGGSFFVHVPDSMALMVGHYLQSMGSTWTLKNWVILHQQFGQYRETSFIASKHHLLHFVKYSDGVPQQPTWNVEEVLEPSKRLLMGDKRVNTAKFKGWRPFLDVWYGENLGRVQGNNAERRPVHPNQLPEMYLARIIRCASNPGDLIVDPFVGSGTSLVVARALGRRVAGSEVNPEYAESAWDRIINVGPVRDVAGPLHTYSSVGDPPIPGTEEK